MSDTRTSHRSARRFLGLLALPVLVFAGCADDDNNGDGGTAGNTNDGNGDGSACEGYPTDDIEFVVPYSAGGGFDAWARLVAPVFAENLPNSVNVPVVNREGAGGITGVTEVYGSPPDGTRMVITEPGILATAQISGTSDLDFSQLSAVGRVTVGPEVIVANANSEWNTIEDVQAAASEDSPVLMGTGGLAAINIVSFDALEIPFDNVVHEGSSEALLSVIRGDTQIALFPLSSVAEGIRAGDLKPLLVVGTAPGDENPDADVVEGIPTLDEATGEDGLGAALEQHRIVVGPPELPECIVQIQSDALTAVFEDPEFITQVEEAGLVPAHTDAAEAQGILQNTIDTLNEYSDLLEESFES